MQKLRFDIPASEFCIHANACIFTGSRWGPISTALPIGPRMVEADASRRSRRISALVEAFGLAVPWQCAAARRLDHILEPITLLSGTLELWEVHF